ncbi:hypothetical protein BX600DRAFT_499383 [Xylariales sp. PMI_506]|nr:hypothetical protein BX600DRAFT_499383 [Xylariales sp. PMI_506]
MTFCPNKPTILLVQGSFQLPDVYQKLVRALEASDYSVVFPPLPSLTHPELPDFPSKTLADDAFAVQTEAQRLVQEEGKAVAIVMHSCAFVIAEGLSVLDAFGESPNSEVKPDGRFTIKYAATRLYEDLPTDEAEFWGSKIIVQSYAVQTTKLPRGSYRYVPSTYVVCENDQTGPPNYQEMFAGITGAELRRIGSGHSPMLSHPELLGEMIDNTIRNAPGH